MLPAMQSPSAILSGRAALVTGASSGIGLAVARLLADRGCGVTMVARDENRLQSAAFEGALPISADAADEEAMGSALQRHIERWGRLDIVVANAGIGRAGGVGNTPPHRLERVLRTNLLSLFTLGRLTLPALRDAGAEHRGAWFIVTASISGLRPMPGYAAYSASKAAALSVARSIDAEESQHGVRACALCPAFVDTPMTESTRDRVPADAMLPPSDVAAAVDFLLALSPNASVTEIAIGRTGAPPLEP